MRYHRRTQPRPWVIAVSATCLAFAVVLSTRLAQSGLMSPLTAVCTAVEIPFDAAVRAVGGTLAQLVAMPGLTTENQRLRSENGDLRMQIAQMREAAATLSRDRAIASLAGAYTKSIVADCIGYDPENTDRSIIIDQGSLAGVTRDAGVINEDGVIGRVIEVTPFSSRVLLLDSYISNIPAIVQRGRYWGIARGSLMHVKLDDVELDAPLKLGEMVITGRGRSFPAGIPIGKIIAISRSDAALTQSAVVEPNVDFSRLERVVVLPHLNP